MSGAAPALRLAGRDLRGGLGRFRIFLACLVLGVAAIAAVGSVGAAITAGLQANGRELLGGDLEFALIQRVATPAERGWLAARGALSEIRRLRAMARHVSGAQRTLVELKAVDGAYPLFGRAVTAPALAPDTLLARRDGAWGAAVDDTLLARLGAALGERIRIGDSLVELRAVLTAEPDRGADAFALGPRVLVAAGMLEESGLIQPGSLVNVAYRLALPAGQRAGAVAAAARAAFPDAGWRIRTADEGAPGLRQFVDRLTQFLALVGLTALVVGGVGVGSAVEAHMADKTRTVAILKALGAPAALIFQTYLFQVLILALVGVALGLALGGMAPYVLSGVLADRLPVPPQAGLYPWPLAQAALFGLVTALLFTLWPLARAREVSPARLFRDLVAPDRRWPRPAYLAAIGLAAAALVALAIVTAPDLSFALWFVPGVAATFGVLRLAGALVVLAARRLPRPSRPGLRLALANLHRPGAATATVILSLGLGLTLMVAIALVQRNVGAAIGERLPQAAPAFFFIDLQPDQIDPFVALVSGFPGAGDLRYVPSLRGRISAVNGVPARDWKVAPDGRWALRGDRGVSYAAAPPDGADLVAGRWWPADYSGPPLISFDARVAEAMGVGVGDRLTINVLGRDIEARIASLRRIQWLSLTINFAIILSPGSLAGAPHSYLATVKADGPAEEALFRAVTDRFPNVTVVRMKEALDSVDKILRQLALAVEAAAAVTLAAGVLVLAGALAAGQRRRLYDAAILKVLGASRAQLIGAFVLEYAILGAATGVVAFAAGSLAGFGVVRGLMGQPWRYDPGFALLGLGAGLALTLGCGLIALWRGFGDSPAQVLRR